MKITITAVVAPGSPPASPASFVLSAGGVEGPSDFKINGSRHLQVVELLRAPGVKVKDRKNRKSVISFSVTRLHDSTGKAESYMLLHETTIPGGGTVTFVSEDGISSYMKDAGLETTECSYKGCTTFHSYSLTGAPMSSSK